MNVFPSVLAALAISAMFVSSSATQVGDTDGDGVLDSVDNCQLVANPLQRDTNGDGFGNLCDPDLDGNGVVNVIDLGLLKVAFFSTPAAPNWNPDADFNGDNAVNAIDLGRLKLYFFHPPGPVAFARWNVDTDGSWSDSSNWFPVAVPDGDVYVVIDRAVPVTVTFDGVAGNNSVLVVNSNNTLVLTGGTLTVTDTIQVNNTFTLAGGRLNSARVLPGDAGQGVATGDFTISALDDVTLEADLSVSNGSTLNVYNDLTLDNASVTLAADDSPAYLVFVGNQSHTLGGTGELVFGGTTTLDSLNWAYKTSGGGAFTVGPGITTRTATAGGRLGWSATSTTIQGPVISNLPGRRLTIAGAPLMLEHDIAASGGSELEFDGQWTNPAGIVIGATDSVLITAGTWSNLGSIDLSNSPAILGGEFATADLLNVNSDSQVSIAGTLDVSALALNTDTAPPGLLIEGGTVLGGSIEGSLPLNLSGSGGLHGVTLATDFVVNDASSATVRNGVVLAGGDIRLASGGSFCHLRFTGTQSVSGSGEILFGGTTTLDNQNWMYQNASGQILTLAPGITVRADTAGGLLGWTGTGLTIRGSVVSNLPGRTITLAGNALSVEGPITGSAGGNLAFGGSWTNAAGNSIVMNDGELALGGDWTNNGIINVTDGTLKAGVLGADAWSNNGVIDVTNSPALLGGMFSPAALFSVTSDGAVTVVGEVLNTGLVTDLDALGALNIGFGNGGRVTGGTLSGAGDFSIASGISFTFDGVTLQTDVTVENGTFLYVNNGLTLNAANVTLASVGGTTQLQFSGTQSLGGTGEVRFGGTTPSDSLNVIQIVSGALTIGADVIVRTATSGGRIGNASYGVTIAGSVVSDIAGRSVKIDGAPLTVDGSLSIGDGAGVTSASANFDLSSSASVDIDIGPSGNGAISSSGMINLDGTLNLALVGGAMPIDCDLYDVIAYAAYSGAFAAVNGPDLGGSTFDVLYFDEFASLQTPGTGCQINLSLLPNVSVSTSSVFSPAYLGEEAIDGVNAGNSSWCTANNDLAPEIEIQFDTAVQVDAIQILTSWSPTYDFLSGTIVARDEFGVTLYDSGVVSLSGGELDLDIVPDTAGVRTVTFSGVTWNSIEPCLSEIVIMGPVP